MKQVKLILGTMTFGESVFEPQVGAFIHAFLDAGYDELDTAYVYNEGNCEKLLGQVLPGLDRPFRIATKVNPRISGRLDADAASHSGHRVPALPRPGHAGGGRAVRHGRPA